MAGKRVAKQKPKKCPHRSSVMTPCYVEDGEEALVGGKCAGCGKTPDETNQENVAPVLPEDRAATFRKMNKHINMFAAKMKKKMLKGLLEGKTGWDTWPAWKFMDGLNKNVDHIRAGEKVSEATVDLANYAMLIEMRQK
jgi:hypothetical protein